MKETSTRCTPPRVNEIEMQAHILKLERRVCRTRVRSLRTPVASSTLVPARIEAPLSVQFNEANLRKLEPAAVFQVSYVPSE